MVVLWVSAIICGCQPSELGVGKGSAAGDQFSDSPTSSPADRPVAMLGSETIALSDLHQGLVEAAGGQVLLELVLDRLVARQLAEHGARLTESQVAAEKQALLQTLADDADQAQRLLEQLCEQRGLGPSRFDRLMRRNAGLRLLVADEVEVTEAAMRQTYELMYGPRYEVRLIVVGSLTEAAEVIRRSKAGEWFTDLAIELSRDVSRAQGGLLSPFSAADTTYPAAIRATAAKLEVGQVSDPVAVDAGFAVLRLESKREAQKVEFEDVAGELAAAVRRRLEQVRMQQLSRRLVEEARVLVLDPALSEAWSRQRRTLVGR